MSIPVVARYRTHEDQLPSVLELLGKVALLNRAEEGCERFDVYRDRSDPYVIVLLEQWSSQEHIAEHHASWHFQQLVLGELVPLLASREVIELVEVPICGP